MCQLLGEDVKTSNSKKAQLKNWERFIAWNQSGYKYIITDIYDEPLPIKDRRLLGNRSIYVPFMNGY